MYISMLLLARCSDISRALSTEVRPFEMDVLISARILHIQSIHQSINRQVFGLTPISIIAQRYLFRHKSIQCFFHLQATGPG